MSIFITGNIDIAPLLKARDFFIRGIKEAHSELEKAGAIQAFEICYELAWKFMKRILSFRGIETASPREVFRLAAQEKIIDDLNFWFGAIVKRNLTTHVYNLDVAKEIFNYLPQFAKELNEFINRIQKI